MFEGVFSLFTLFNANIFTAALEMLLCFQNCCQQQVQVRVEFGSKMNSAHGQHVISTIWYISLSRDWLTCFRFLFMAAVTSTT